LAQLLDRFEIPLASWFVDHPMLILGGAGGNATQQTKIFTFERQSMAWLQQQGYGEPTYLPTASNERFFRPDRVRRDLAEELRHPLTFAGDSWWSKARAEPPRPLRQKAEEFWRQHRVARDTLGNELETQLKSACGTAFDPYELGQVVVAEASMRSRQRFATALRALGLRVHGDAAWAQLVPGIELKPYLPYDSALPALFVASAINANVTADQMPTAVNQRVWDVPAVGGFLLTDAQEDALMAFREGEEIVVYRSFEEAVDLARFYLARPELRRAIAERGRARVEQAHRYTNRLQTVVETMRRTFGTSSIRKGGRTCRDTVAWS
jgi:spore maturation protein CgeB